VGNSFAHAVHRKTRWANQLPTLHFVFQTARWRVVGLPTLLIISTNRRGLLSSIWRQAVAVPFEFSGCPWVSKVQQDSLKRHHPCFSFAKACKPVFRLPQPPQRQPENPTRKENK